MATIIASRFRRLAAGDRLRRLAVGVVGTVATSVAFAQETPLLTKPEVEALTVGKTFKYLRASDGRTVSFDVRSGGKVYYSPPNTARNLSIGGEWTIEDDGGLCFKWESDKYVGLQNGCYKFRHVGDKVRVVGGRNPDSIVGEVIP